MKFKRRKTTQPTKIEIANRDGGGLTFMIDGRDYAFSLANSVEVSLVGDSPEVQEFGVTVTFVGVDLHIAPGVWLNEPNKGLRDASAVVGELLAASEIEP